MAIGEIGDLAVDFFARQKPRRVIEDSGFEHSVRGAVEPLKRRMILPCSILQ